MVAIHCFFRPDQRVNSEHATFARRQFYFHAVPGNFIEVADAQNFPQAVENSQVRLQIQIPQTRALIRCQRQRQIGSRTMHRMQISQCSLYAHQICLAEPAANIHIPRHERDSVSHCCKAADQHELNLACNQPARQFAKILHFASPLPRAKTRQNSARRRWPASVPMAFLPGCPSVVTNQHHHRRPPRRWVIIPAKPLARLRFLVTSDYFVCRL